MSARRTTRPPTPTPPHSAHPAFVSVSVVLAAAQPTMFGASLRRAVVAVATRAVRPRLAELSSAPMHSARSTFSGALAPVTSQFAVRAMAQEARPLSEKPDGCLTVFMGNLPFSIDEDVVVKLCKDNGIPEPTRVRWLTDRETGSFKGSGFVEFDNTNAVDKFVQLNGTLLSERTIRVDYAVSRPREAVRPDRRGGGDRGDRRVAGSGGGGRFGGGGGGGGGANRRDVPLSDKPPGCTTVFLGNLARDIDDDDIYAKAREIGTGNIKSIRWLTDRETGDFRGCGFVDFESTEDADKFAKLNGSVLKNRYLRVDYAKPREPRQNRNNE